MGLWWRLRGVYMEHSQLYSGTFSAEKFFSPVKIRPKNSSFFRGGWVEMLNFCCLTQKRHIARNRVVWRILRENRFGSRAVGRWKNRKKPIKHFLMLNFAHTGKRNPVTGIVTKFCTWVGIRDLITYATFGDDRLRPWVWACWGVEFPVSPLTCVVVLRTLRQWLSCECVMT